MADNPNSTNTKSPNPTPTLDPNPTPTLDPNPINTADPTPSPTNTGPALGPTNIGPALGPTPYSFGMPGYNPTQHQPFTFQVLSPARNRPEPGDLLYSPASDGPEITLIKHQLTGPENYSTWARDFQRTLVVKDKDGFLDDRIPPPHLDSPLRRHWNRCNTLVRSWMSNCMSLEVVAGLPPTKIAAELWKHVKDMYGKLDLAKLFTLRQQLAEISQGNSSVTQYFNKLSTIWYELDAAEETIEGSPSVITQYQRI